jgi:UDPglucose 6-dehydrogenase
MFVTIIGTGYVGTVTGACLAYLGHDVTCVDTDANKIQKLRNGELPIHEPGLGELLQAARRGRLSFTTELAGAVATSEVIFIAVGTPPTASGAPNLSYLEAAAHAIGRALIPDRFCVIVNKSTVPVGSGNLVESLVREGIASVSSRPEDFAFGVASNPEFLREGRAVLDSLYPDRIVIGASDERTINVLRNLYQPLLEQSFEAPSASPRLGGRPQLLVTSLTSAEMIKYAANAFLALKIGFANEIANICERVGADALEVMLGIGSDSRIGSKFLNPGIGWGGSCFGKDLQALLHTAREYAYPGKILQAALEVNCDQRQTVLQKLQQHLRILKGRTIGLLGLSFKPETDDLRDAPSLDLAARLQQIGARVRAYDPVSMSACRRQRPDLKIVYCDSPEAVAANADALVVVTEWQEFRALDLRRLAETMTTAVLIDGRNIFTPDAATAAGFSYSGVGRGSHFAARRTAVKPFEGADAYSALRSDGAMDAC